jgi:sugar/nucleoside kinase (ribokinase family)
LEYDVFAIGTALVDFFAKSTDDFLKKNGLVKGATNFFPRKKLDELHEELSDSIFTCMPGDNARNVCEGVSYLGGKVAYASSVALDPEGDFFLKNLKTHGIHSSVTKKPGRTGKIIVLITPDCQRTFAVDLGNSEDYDSFPKKVLLNSRYFYLTSITLLASGKLGGTVKDALKFAEKESVKVAISLESPPMIKENRRKILEMIGAADVLFANEDELAALEPGGDATARELAAKIGAVYLKKGEKGSKIFTKSREFSIPCYSKKTVDTTGAGDFYAAGAIRGLSLGKSPEEAGKMGAKLAGKVVAHFGATARKASCANFSPKGK